MAITGQHKDDDGNVLYPKHINVNVLFVACPTVVQAVTTGIKWVKGTKDLCVI